MHPPPSSMVCTGGIAEALLWFHLTRQLVERLEPGSYSIEEVVTSGEVGKQCKRWLRDELPSICRLDRVTITKAMGKAFKKEVEQARERGLLINIA